MTDTPRLWDRRADETPKSYAAFLAYVALGARRSCKPVDTLRGCPSLAWVCTEAVRTQRRELVLGRSLYEFMHKLGMDDRSGGANAERTRARSSLSTPTTRMRSMCIRSSPTAPNIGGTRSNRTRARCGTARSGSGKNYSTRSSATRSRSTCTSSRASSGRRSASTSASPTGRSRSRARCGSRGGNSTGSSAQTRPS